MVEVRLKEHPDDGDGWDVIAPVYLRIERFKEAAHAYAQAIRLKGETMKRLAGLAEAHVLAENGIIGDAARQAYQRMSRLDPKHPIPRFWLALAKEQDGELKAALEDYEALIKEAAPDADYREPVQQRLDLVRKRLASAGAGDAARAPAIDPKSATAIERLPPEEQLRAINAMVDGLAARLDKNGRDLEGWQRLIRAYVVLKKQEDAKRALARARVALADDKAALEALAALASGLGLGS